MIAKIKVNDRVRLVTMNGCMGNVKVNPREGVVIEIVWRQVYGDAAKRFYAKIRLDNGDVEERCVDSRLWSMHDGLPEYQD